MRGSACVAILVALMISAGSSWAGYWHVANHGLYAASFNDILIDPVDPDVLILSGAGGIYRTTDGGANWVSSSTGLPPGSGAGDLAMDPSDHLVIYGAAGGSVVKSSDGGLTWTSHSAGITHPYISGVAVAPSSPNIVYAGTIIGGDHGGMYKSTDSGVTWTQVAGSDIPGSGLGNDAAPVRVDPNDADLVYCAKTYYVDFFKSTDGGHHWRVTDNQYPIKAIAVDPGEPNRIYAGGSGGLKVSLDYGETWTPTAVTGQVTAIEVAPSDANIVYALTFDNGVWKSTDHGVSWSQPGGYLAQFIGLVVHPSSPEAVYAVTTGAGVLKSVDGGVAFSEVNTGLPTTILGECVAVQPGSGDVYLMIRGQGLYRSSDDGTTWDQLARIPQRVLDFRIHARLTSTMFFASDDGYRSTDNGVTWQPLSVESNEPWVSNVTANPILAGELWASAGSLLRHSVDGGASWSTVFDCPRHPEWWNSTGIADIEVDPRATSRIYLATGNHPWRSDNRGGTWTKLDTLTYEVWYGQPPELKNTSFCRDITIDPTSTNIVYCTTQWGGVWKSTDYGDTWVRLPIPDDVLLTTNNVVIDPRDHNVLYVSSLGGWQGVGKGVWRSPDGGQSWELLDSGLIGNDSYVYWVALSQNTLDRVFAVTPVSGVYRSSVPISWWPFQPGWNMFSFPVEPDNGDPAVIFSGLEPPNTLDGALCRWHPDTGRYIVYTSADPGAFGTMGLGEGYWLHIEKEQSPLTLWGSPPAGEGRISLAHPGWYLIGHTWQNPVELSRFSVARNGGLPVPLGDAVASWIGDPLVGYDPALWSYYCVTTGGLFTDHELRPSEGYWAYGFVDNLTLTIPVP